MSNELSTEQIQEVFRLDFSDIMGFDLFKLPMVITFLDSDPTYMILDNDRHHEARGILSANVQEAIDVYFTWNPQRFKHPLEQYEWIAENEENIRTLIARDMDVDYVNECPIKATINCVMQQRLNKLFKYLVTVGSTHKFDPEIISSRLEENEEDSED